MVQQQPQLVLIGTNQQPGNIAVNTVNNVLTNLYQFCSDLEGQ